MPFWPPVRLGSSVLCPSPTALPPVPAPARPRRGAAGRRPVPQAEPGGPRAILAGRRVRPPPGGARLAGRGAGRAHASPRPGPRDRAQVGPVALEDVVLPPVDGTGSTMTGARDPVRPDARARRGTGRGGRPAPARRVVAGARCRDVRRPTVSVQRAAVERVAPERALVERVLVERAVVEAVETERAVVERAAVDLASGTSDGRGDRRPARAAVASVVRRPLAVVRPSPARVAALPGAIVRTDASVRRTTVASAPGRHVAGPRRAVSADDRPAEAVGRWMPLVTVARQACGATAAGRAQVGRAVHGRARVVARAGARAAIGTGRAGDRRRQPSSVPPRYARCGRREPTVRGAPTQLRHACGRTRRRA